MLMPNVRADLARYMPANPNAVDVIRALLQFGFIATAVFRYGKWTNTIRPKVLSYPFKLVYSLLSTLCEVLFGIYIGGLSEIGPGFYIGHFSCIVIVGKIGANCSVGQGVTIGFKGAGMSTLPPTLGDNVYVGTSALIIGAITVGDNVVIGANTTVVKDVPAGYTVVSAPVRLIPPKDLA
jgi:serine O-acetyltransferase